MTTKVFEIRELISNLVKTMMCKINFLVNIKMNQRWYEMEYVEYQTRRKFIL